jgi:hypothetical protein
MHLFQLRRGGSGTACGLAPLITSHSMSAISPKKAGWQNRKYLALVMWPPHAGKGQGKVGEAGPFSPRLIRFSSLCAQLFSS